MGGRKGSLGGIIRRQRELQEMSLRQLAQIAGISNPYLSQIEHGLREPSERVLESMAQALQISADTLYKQAGRSRGEQQDDDVEPAVVTAIKEDSALTGRQRRALLEVYLSFTGQRRPRRSGSNASPRILGCDIRYAGTSAVFRVAFINVGASNCDMGTSWLLPRLIGASRAHELMLTGRRVGAPEAERIGLVADVVEDDRLLDRALEAATQVAQWAPWAVRLTKQCMWSALEIPSEQAAIEYEDRQQIMVVQSNAMQEAVAAYLEKRPAHHRD